MNQKMIEIEGQRVWIDVNFVCKWGYTAETLREAIEGCMVMARLLGYEVELYIYSTHEDFEITFLKSDSILYDYIFKFYKDGVTLTNSRDKAYERMVSCEDKDLIVELIGLL